MPKPNGSFPKVLGRTLGLIQQHRGMMADNRGFRAAAYRQRSEVDLEDALKRDNGHLEQVRQSRPWVESR